MRARLYTPLVVILETGYVRLAEIVAELEPPVFVGMYIIGGSVPNNPTEPVVHHKVLVMWAPDTHLEETKQELVSKIHPAHLRFIPQ